MRISLSLEYRPMAHGPAPPIVEPNTLEDISHLNASAVFGIFTWDEVRSQNIRDEMDIELSRWGDRTAQNAQYAVQPFYLPANLFRFSAPAGALTHELHWDAAAVSFRTWRGSDTTGRPLAEHTFSTNLPDPGREMVHMDLYDFHHAENKSGSRTEDVVVESFRFAK